MDTITPSKDSPLTTSPPSKEAAFCEDSRSETSTVDTEERADLTHLTFFTRLYEIPVVSDAVSSIYRIAESNRYTSAIIGYAEKVGGFAEKSWTLLKPVEKPIVVLDSYATRSLEIIESKYPIVGKPTSEVIQSVQTQAKAVESRYPVVARTFAIAKSTANSALDRVDYLVDYVLPPPTASGNSNCSAKGESATRAANASQEDTMCLNDQGQQQTATLAADSPLGKVTILVHKLPQRLGQRYYHQLQNSKATIGGLRQSVKDTVNVYESEVSDRSYKLLESVQERVKTTVNSTIPSFLPQFAQPYYEHGKELLVTKAAKLHAEYSRKDEDTRSKVLNLILISGEQVP
ncbi:hypothetical protein GGI23_005670, partial [Coemansia sp. RSA 2559]